MKISIVTAAFNSAATIRDTFDSILSQNFDDYEYIVVDGKSRDETVDIIKEYEPKFNGKMRWISEKDSGLYDAMNKGIRMASGEYVGILNSDDFFADENVLSSIAETLENNPVDAIYGDVDYVRPDDLKCVVRHYSSANFKRWKMRIGLMPAHPTFYARKELFDKIGYYRTDYKISADYELLLRFIFVNGITTYYIPKVFVTMRVGGVSTNSLKVHWCIMKEHLHAFKINGRYSDIFLQSLRYWGKVYDLFKAKISR